jgi:hypothetical protein
MKLIKKASYSPNDYNQIPFLTAVIESPTVKNLGRLIESSELDSITIYHTGERFFSGMTLDDESEVSDRLALFLSGPSEDPKGIIKLLMQEG